MIRQGVLTSEHQNYKSKILTARIINKKFRKEERKKERKKERRKQRLKQRETERELQKEGKKKEKRKKEDRITCHILLNVFCIDLGYLPGNHEGSLHFVKTEWGKRKMEICYQVGHMYIHTFLVVES